jgi:hypothetical protein
LVSSLFSRDLLWILGSGFPALKNWNHEIHEKYTNKENTRKSKKKDLRVEGIFKMQIRLSRELE